MQAVMRRYVLSVCILLTALGCPAREPPTSTAPTAPTASSGPRVDELAGKWRLVRVDGKEPAEMMVKAAELELAADGTWKSRFDLGGAGEGMTLRGGGKWSVADGVISYNNGQESGTSRVRLNGGRLVLEPDFQLRKNDASKRPLNTEYER
jgi:hypothetical protein